MSTITMSSGHLRPLPFQEPNMKQKLNPWSRLLLLIATLILPIAYFTPIWRIQLWAPQYPEGLEMQIWIDKLSGSIKIINGLNHYIGMANIEESMFPELQFLKYLLGAIIGLGILSFILNRKFMLKLFTAVILVFAIAAMVDMYLWGYKYGHNLDPHAAIKVEGQSYQPPLIGYKQLLNFTALSIPDKGGIALFGSGFIAVLAVVLQWAKNRRAKHLVHAASVLFAVFLLSCQAEPERLKYNKDDCDYCGMKLVDDRFGGLIVTDKGKQFKFDDINCMLNFRNENLGGTKISKILIADFSAPGTLTDATKAHYLKKDDLGSPMGGNTAAFENADSLNKYYNTLSGEKTDWNSVGK